MALAEDALPGVAKRMLEHRIGAVVVVDRPGPSARPIGIVTDRDVVCGQLNRQADLFCLSVQDVMTPQPTVISADSDLSEAVEKLRSASVRRAPVVDRFGQLIGIVTLDDLLPALAARLNELAGLLGTQARLERSPTPAL